MSMTSSRLPNLMNGVSQQAISMRLKSQAEAQINGISSVVEGVGKRPPLKHVTKLFAGQVGNVFTHTINRDISERYKVLITNANARVFDLTGIEKTVTYPNGTGYITTATPKSALRAVTVQDNTFIVNTEVDVASLTSKSAKNGSEAMAFIKAVAYGVTYSIVIDGVEKATYKTTEAAVATVAATVTEVIDDLGADLVTNLGAGWTVTKYSPIIHIEKDDGTAFTLEVKDDRSNTMSEAVTQQFQRFTDLPVVGKKDFIVEITGDEESAFDNYYLKFVPNNDTLTFDDGVWQESLAPDIEYKLDPATMPHLLVRQSGGDFTIEQAVWDERIAGDLKSAKWPSFVGRKINDVFFFRNRLCVLSDSNMICSGAGDYFRFFPETVTKILDDGPIDVAASHTKVSLLRRAIPFNGNLILFSDQTQFSLKDEALLASNPPNLPVLSEYESSLAAEPVGVGSSVYFAMERKGFSGVKEYFVVPNTETAPPADVTKHVPKYIPAGVFKMATTANDDMMVVLTEGDPSKPYIYKFFWQGDQKLQSSWSQWDFGATATVLDVDFIASEAFFVTQYSDGVYLETVDVTEGQVDTDATFVYRLDRRVDEVQTTLVYDAGTDQTTVALPYSPTTAVRVVTRHGASSDRTPATTLDVISVTGTDVVVRGDLTNTLFYAGEDYTFRYRFSEPVLKDATETGGLATVAVGRLQLRRWTLMFEGTGYFRAEVTPRRGASTFKYRYTGKQLGAVTIGGITMTDGSFTFKVNGNAKNAVIEIINDSFLPSYFTSAEWEGRYTRRTSGV